jgi:L-2-hydroxyglutarate oxidase LhgO
MLSLLADAQHEGAVLVCRTEVQKLEATNQGVAVTTAGRDTTSIVADLVVNAAGLDAPDLVRSTLNNTAGVVPNAFYAKGTYFSLRGLAPFSHLVYPVPESGGLGIHYTIDLNNRAKFGPDVQWVTEKNYDVIKSSANEFYGSIKRYWPGVQKEDLSPDYAGIRPKISGPNEPAVDFVVQGPREHGVSGLINLFGIESPGLTASMAIADYVVAY